MSFLYCPICGKKMKMSKIKEESWIINKRIFYSFSCGNNDVHLTVYKIAPGGERYPVHTVTGKK